MLGGVFDGRRRRIMDRHGCDFTDASDELGLCSRVWASSTPFRVAPWRGFNLRRAVLAVFTAFGIFSLSADDTMPSPEGQIWAARASDAGAVDSVTLAPDGRMLVSADSNGHAILWSVATGKRVKAQPARFHYVRSLAFSPDGRTLAAGGLSGSIELRRGERREAKQVLRVHRAPVVALAYSPDGCGLASTSSDGMLVFWRVGPDYASTDVSRSESSIASIRFSPDGRCFATSHMNGEVRMRSVGSPGRSSLVGCFPSIGSGLAFSPDGRTLAVSTMISSQVVLWDLVECRVRKSLAVAAAGAGAVAYSPDGTALAVAGSDGTLHLWNVAAGHHYATIRGHRARALSIVFSRDGRTLVSGGNDHCIKLWDVATLFSASDQRVAASHIDH
jgi:WD40 repeat protein